MIATFADYLREQGTHVDTSEADKTVLLDVAHGGRSWKLVLTEESHGGGETPDVLVQLRGAPQSPSASCTWFSLLERTRGGPSTEFAEEVSDFIARYGVRFARADEE
jgi:hypothetical protein